MYDVSQTWKTLVAQDNHYFKTRVKINNVTYTQDKIFEITTNLRMFSEEQPTVGGCLSTEITVKLLTPSASIPRMAKIEPFVQVTDGTTSSEWIPQGTFWVDTREETKNDDGLDILTLHGYDAMLKAEADMPVAAVSHRDTTWVRIIANAMGLQPTIPGYAGIDPRTATANDGGTGLMKNDYNFSVPPGYSMREVLSNIAAMYCGNWVISYDNKLLLIALNGIPSETNYLINAIGEAITFGGDKILV